MALGKLPEDETAGGAIFADINITPLTDIFLVLLIIFMVGSSVMVVESASRQGVKVNLPKGANKEVDPAAKSLVVTVTTQGEIMLEGQRVTIEDLDGSFKSAAARDPMTQIIIEADTKVEHGSVVGIMERAKAAGLSKLAIATKAGK